MIINKVKYREWGFENWRFGIWDQKFWDWNQKFGDWDWGFKISKYVSVNL